MGKGLTACAVLLGAIGCDAAGSTLIVQVRTDLFPGTEIAEVVTMLEPDGTPVHFDVDSTQAWGMGVRVAQLPVSAGTFLGTVAAFRDDGASLVSRPFRVEVAEDEVRVVTVLLTRDCEGITCPGTGDPTTRSACLGGRCVEDTCTEDDAETCEPPACEVGVTCVTDVDECVTPMCTSSGTCFLEVDHMVCGDLMACDVALGCRDTGRPADAGASDAGASDAGASDAGASDASIRDAGVARVDCTDCRSPCTTMTEVPGCMLLVGGCQPCAVSM